MAGKAGFSGSIGQMRTVRALLVGLGNLGRRFCDILAAKDPLLQARYGIHIVLVGAADSRGGAYAPEGLSPALLSRLKLDGMSAADYPGFGRHGWSQKTWSPLPTPTSS
jgi:homoserine dehydrogenase